jgi:chromosome segregation protein
MYLKKLELSGFKSFAKAASLEFPSRITAIVGPNGAGKTNLKDAIQWVLGEQSMKSLRGKKAEDLIWSGSSSLGRIGKAVVSLTFDNSARILPLDFDEAVFSRKIFRDGEGEYLLNHSPARLKDVADLAARMGLGETKYNIIGQGEVDRILLSSPRERREMIEEALGLRIHQLKKRDAERKLQAVENDMEKVASLIREIAPHVKYLREQMKKVEARGKVEEELRKCERAFAVREKGEIAREQAVINARKSPLRNKRLILQEEIAAFAKRMKVAEDRAFRPAKAEGDQGKLSTFRERQRELERELGRLEGKMEIPPVPGKKNVAEIDPRYLYDRIDEFILEARSALEGEEDVGTLRAHLFALIEDLEYLVRAMEQGAVRISEAERVESPEYAAKREAIREEMAVIERALKDGEEKRNREETERQRSLADVRRLDALLRRKRDEEREVVIALERLGLDEGRIRAREEEWKRMVQDAGADLLSFSRAAGGASDLSPAELARKIERLKIRLEEIGGIDPAVEKECREREARLSFLSKELEDLEKAKSSLKELMRELETHIAADFKKGFARVRDAFGNYFKIIFGGGKAALRLVSESPRGEDGREEWNGENGPRGDGIEIVLALPQKRIKGLSMLSGGERALTSVAFLFAMASVNPPPFLVLDETDAALDEANSRRYAHIVRELSKKTQLILITHNRETMRCAGCLYGVTVGEDGASRLLSLKLEEAEEYTNR